ncbi:MAG: sugar ABC transporter ATP-binding protein [Candidatus Limiplasma sp.]|nr:sugar ABC transporter ATP-binding protein [Candidatus Limiplasma sp.]
MANIIEMKGIRKSFGGVPVLLGADFSLAKGEVVALVGENGAGKSTLMRILTGIYQMDEGEVLYGGERVSFKNAKESSAAGIQIIHQEFNLFPNLSVAENIFLDNPGTLRHGLVDWKLAKSKAQELVRSIGGSFDVTDKVSTLSVQNQQIVEIVKALATDAQVLIMDEPTSALPENEVQNLFRTIRALKDRGVGIIYVSHRLNEIFEICERIAVLRDGVTVAQRPIAEMTQMEVITQMVGRDVGRLYPNLGNEAKDEVFAVEHLKDEDGIVKDVSFSVRAGEILGLYGLMGSGATECPEMIFGLAPGVSGKVSVKGQALRKFSVPEAIAKGIAYVPADRHRQGIVQQLSVRFNVTLAVLKRLSGKLLVKRKREDEVTREYIRKLHVKCAGDSQQLSSLSGGNQQKVVIAKWLATEPSVLILNDPTRGVDVGAKAEIYRIISELALGGMGVVITSSDIDEILGMSDRILVFKKGRIAEAVSRGEATLSSLLATAVSG